MHFASLSPEVFRERLAGLEEQRFAARPADLYYCHCVGCGPGHPVGPRIRSFKDETPLLGRARHVTDHGRDADVEGRIEEFARGQVLATGRGRFVFGPGESATSTAGRERAPITRAAARDGRGGGQTRVRNARTGSRFGAG